MNAIEKALAALRGLKAARTPSAGPDYDRRKLEAYAQIMGISLEEAERHIAPPAVKEAQHVRYKGSGRTGTFRPVGAPEPVATEEPADGLAGNMPPAQLLTALKQYTRPAGQRRKQAAPPAPSSPVDKALAAFQAAEPARQKAADDGVDYAALAADFDPAKLDEALGLAHKQANAAPPQLPGLAGAHKALSVADVAGDAEANQVWAAMHRQLGSDWLGPKSGRR
jgi:hypothetical protein